MTSLTDLSIRRPVATAMVYLVLVTLGLVSLRHLPIDLLPEVEVPSLSIGVSYPNVGPEEMERLVTQPLENAISGVPNLVRIHSRINEGSSWTSLDFSRGTDMSEAANDVRDALDRFRGSLPPEVDPPRLRKFDPDAMPIVSMAVSSTEYDLETLTRIAERELTRRFEQLEGVGTIDLQGGLSREVRVELHRDRLQAAGLTPSEVQQAVARAGTVAPGGNVKDGVRDLYVRALAEYENLQQIEDVVIRQHAGIPVRVRDVADVSFGLSDPSRLVRLEDQPVLLLRARKQSGTNTVAVARSIRAEVERINRTRGDLTLRVIDDNSTFIQSSIDNVRSSAVWGGALAILILYAFLRNGSSTFIIALSIPISLVTTFAALYFRDLSLNLMTFGGLALGIGLIVDNAIVVLENIVRRREEGGDPPLVAASRGTRQVAGAIIASTLTSSVIFLPVVFMQTVTAVLFLELALVVIFALFCSLFVALTLVPVLASRYLHLRETTKDNSGAGQSSGKTTFHTRFARLERRYQSWVAMAISHRLLVFSSVVVLIGGALLLSRLVPVELAPQTDANQVRINVRMDDGTNLAVVVAYLDELESLVRSVVPADKVSNLTTEVWRGRARINITLPDTGERSLSSTELADTIRQTVSGAVPGVQVSVQARSGLWVIRQLFSRGGGDDSIELRLQGHDQDQAIALGREIRGRLSGIPGIRDIRIGGEEDEGQPEQRIRLDRQKIAALGLSIEDITRALQLSVGGGRAGFFRFSGDEYPIRVRLRPQDRATTLDLDGISVRTPAGEMITIGTVTSQERSRASTGINRLNGQRVTYIRANLESGVALGRAVGEIERELRQFTLPEGFYLVYGGEYEEQQKAQRDFILAVLLAVALIYMVMAGQFERFLDPLIVMFSVPLALVGVYPVLWLTGTTLNMQSLMGLIMLIGIVVNNAIVLVDYINLMRREGNLALREAVLEAARLRLRPILITSCTTLVGLLPLALGLGASGEVQAALARTVIGGLAASTLITLLFIPVTYITVHEWKEALLRRGSSRMGSVSPLARSPAASGR